MSFGDDAAVVLDNGTGYIKAGFAGEEDPRYLVPSLLGRPKFANVMLGSANKVCCLYERGGGGVVCMSIQAQQHNLHKLK